MLAILEESNITIMLPNEDIYFFVVRVSTGEINFEGIVDWLKNNTSKL